MVMIVSRLYMQYENPLIKKNNLKLQYAFTSENKKFNLYPITYLLYTN